MVSIIPAVFFAVVVVMLSLFNTPHSNVDFKTQVIGENMILQHDRALQAAEEGHMTSGNVNAPLGGKFADMGNWVSQVYSASGKTVVITTLLNSDKITNDELGKTFAALPASKTDQLPANTAFGPFEMRDGVGYVGTLDVDAFSNKMTAGQNVIISYVN